MIAFSFPLNDKSTIVFPLKLRGELVFLLSIAEMRQKWPFSGHGPEDWVALGEL